MCLVVRQLSEDKTFDEHTLLKGSWVAANIYAVHHNPDTWDEPEVMLYVCSSKSHEYHYVVHLG